MQSFFSDPGGVGREVALNSLRNDIVGLIGGPVRLHDTFFLDAPLADFFASEANWQVYAIRWIDSHDFASAFTRTLSAYVRLNESGRPAMARVFGLSDDFPPPTLILVSDRMEDDWVRVVSALRIPVILLRAHSLVDGTRHSAGCLFEKRYAPPRGQREPHPGLSAPRPAPVQAAAPIAPQAPASPLDDELIAPRPYKGPGPGPDLQIAAGDLDEEIEAFDTNGPAEAVETFEEMEPTEELDLGAQAFMAGPPESEPESELAESRLTTDAGGGEDQLPVGESFNDADAGLAEAVEAELPEESAAESVPEAAEERPEEETEATLENASDDEGEAEAPLDAVPASPVTIPRAEVEAGAIPAVPAEEASPAPSVTWASPRLLLSDEEAATFKLLESILQSRN